MKRSAIVAGFLVLASGSAPAVEPAADACLMLNNRILGPRTADRPLPLLKGDAQKGFTPACSVGWIVLSPKNDALPVEGCFRGSLLQLANDTACGPNTGKLWIGARWVVTSADLAKGTERAAVCQQLETGAWAGTRGFSFECKPRSRELDAAAGESPASAAAPAAKTTAQTPAPTDTAPKQRR